MFSLSRKAASLYLSLVLFLFVTTQKSFCLFAEFQQPSAVIYQTSGDYELNYDPHFIPQSIFNGHALDSLITLDTRYVDLKFYETPTGNIHYLSEITSNQYQTLTDYWVLGYISTDESVSFRTKRRLNSTYLYDVQLVISKYNNTFFSVPEHNMFYSAYGSFSPLNMIIHTDAINSLPNHQYQMELQQCKISYNRTIATISHTGGTFTVVPEPNTIVVLVLSFTVVLRFKKTV